MVADIQDLNDFFSIPGQSTLPSDILGELLSVQRLHSLSSQELFFKWESYSIKMGSENTRLDLDTVRALKKDVQETLEREARGKTHIRASDRRGVHATSRAATRGDDDLLDMLMDSVTPGTQQHKSKGNGAVKRKATYETPAPSKISRSARKSSPTDGRTLTSHTNHTSITPFVDRQDPGKIIETLNDYLSPFEPPIAPSAESRVKLVANTDIKKFAYKPLAMHLSEASEVLDERIDDFMIFVQKHHGLDDSAFGNAASKSTSEIVTVGRIASDTPEGKANASSLVLEMSRRTGAGLRIPLKFEPSISSEFFPGQIVALRGINASGEYFAASEVLELPMLPPAASAPSTIDAINGRLDIEDPEEASASDALNLMVSAGPYTTDDNLDFEALHALCDRAQETSADVLILIGPLLDIEHPLVATGDFDLPDDPSIEPDKATITDVFRVLIGGALHRLAQAIPSITIILVPSVRDAVSKHVCWPQENLSRKELSLPKQVKTVSNPVTISLNETIVAISAQDVLYDLRLEEVTVGVPKEGNLLARLPRHVIQQRHFFPMYPPVNRVQLPKPGTEEGVATGMPLDVSYLKLAEWLNVQPDMLIMPSALPPFAKVVEGVVIVNPGTISKRRGPGTYSQTTIHPRKLSAKEREAPDTLVPHRLYERARVDIIRI